MERRQFTELQQKEQLAKLASAREALAAAASGTRKFKFVSGVNEQVCFWRVCVIRKAAVLHHCITDMSAMPCGLCPGYPEKCLMFGAHIVLQLYSCSL